jgi:hypothetical protein
MRGRQRVALATMGVVWLTAGWVFVTGPAALAGTGASPGVGALAGIGAMAGTGAAPAPTSPLADGAGAGHGSAAGIRRAATESAALVTDSGAALMSKAGLRAPVMSAAMRAANAQKQAMARAFIAAAGPAAGTDGKCVTKACRRGLPTARDLRPTQRAQVNSYYCGPATVTEMLAQMGKSVGQRKTARELGTNKNGTNWSDRHGYPVPAVLNRNQARNDYVAVGLPWSPSGAQLRTYEADLVTDINRQGGAPLAGDAYEVAGGPHLAGHPVNQTIFHWFDIRGYRKSGATTDYEDSVHGASSVGWAAGVPAYSSLPSATIVSIFGARGYDW